MPLYGNPRSTRRAAARARHRIDSLEPGYSSYHRRGIAIHRTIGVGLAGSQNAVGPRGIPSFFYLRDALALRTANRYEQRFPTDRCPTDRCRLSGRCLKARQKSIINRNYWVKPWLTPSTASLVHWSSVRPLSAIVMTVRRARGVPLTKRLLSVWHRESGIGGTGSFDRSLDFRRASTRPKASGH
jgi:hypothetical protein